MKTAIFIVTWSKDLDYLDYCLKSIAKFSVGFSETVVCYPFQESFVFGSVIPQWATGVMYHRVEDPTRWHLDSQACKCYADVYCPNADFIVFLDSDCVFTETVTPEDYFVNGRPVLLYQSFASLPGNPWQEPTERALLKPCHVETMRRHPAVHYPDLLRSFRYHLRKVHRKDPHDYILAQKPDYPWGFSEFCALGAYAWGNPGWMDRYHWIDVEREPYPPSKLMQFWSHSPPDQMQALPSGGKARPMDVYKSLGLV